MEWESQTEGSALLEILNDDDLMHVCEQMDIEDLKKFTLSNKRILDVCDNVLKDKIQKQLPKLISDLVRMRKKFVIVKFSKDNGDKLEAEFYTNYRGYVRFLLDEYAKKEDSVIIQLIMRIKIELYNQYISWGGKSGNKFHYVISDSVHEWVSYPTIEFLINSILKSGYKYQSLSTIPTLAEDTLESNRNEKYSGLKFFNHLNYKDILEDDLPEEILKGGSPTKILEDDLPEEILEGSPPTKITKEMLREMLREKLRDIQEEDIQEEEMSDYEDY